MFFFDRKFCICLCFFRPIFFIIRGWRIFDFRRKKLHYQIQNFSRIIYAKNFQLIQNFEQIFLNVEFLCDEFAFVRNVWRHSHLLTIDETEKTLPMWACLDPGGSSSRILIFDALQQSSHVALSNAQVQSQFHNWLCNTAVLPISEWRQDWWDRREDGSLRWR